MAKNDIHKKSEKIILDITEPLAKIISDNYSLLNELSKH